MIECKITMYVAMQFTLNFINNHFYLVIVHNMDIGKRTLLENLCHSVQNNKVQCYYTIYFIFISDVVLVINWKQRMVMCILLR